MSISGYYIAKQGGEWPVVNCLECDEESLVTSTEAEEAVCFSCGVPFQSLDYCSRCGSAMQSDDESTICSFCWQDISDRAD